LANILNNKFIAFFKLVRIENLIIIALTQFLLRYFVLRKILVLNNIPMELNTMLFNLVVVSTVLIAAAGYIINDYFDVKTDMINHPETVVLDKTIKRRWAIILHISFTFLGIVLGVYAALKTGYLRLAIFHFAAAILLWFYSTHFKKQLLIGNIVVSFLSASVAFIPFVFEIGIMQHVYPNFNSKHLAVILSSFKITFIFALFAFITSLAREIIKDMEDYKGDKETGGKTMPISWGIPASKLTSFFLVVIAAILLTVVVYNSYKSSRILLTVNNIYIVFALVFPLLFLGIKTLLSHSSKQFKQTSLILKFVMLLGLSYSLIFYYN
jgi:4-hydroxybenzoate polyprenyltransferase